MSEHRRVVVTGIGAITPLGNNVADTWEGLKNGRNGIGPITLFDTEKFKVKLGAEVKDFNPNGYLEVNDVYRTDRYAQFACVLMQEAMSEGKIPVYTGLNNVKFRSPVKPGDTVETRCRVKKAKHPFYFAEGTVTVDDRLCVSAEFSFAITGE